MQVGTVSLNTTTFNNLESTGKIRLINSKSLADSIVDYYNTDLMAWQSALRDYTRNIIAPFMLKFDHIPQANVTDNAYDDFINIDINQSKIKPKKLIKKKKISKIISNF